MKTFFITFPKSSPLHRHYVAVRAVAIEQAEDMARQTFGQRFKELHEEAGFLKLAEDRGLSLILVVLDVLGGRAFRLDEILTPELQAWAKSITAAPPA